MEWAQARCDPFQDFWLKSSARIPTEKRKALQPQSQECLFVGYSKDSKGYNMINLSTNKAFIERCVQFEEEPLAEVEIVKPLHHLNLKK